MSAGRYAVLLLLATSCKDEGVERHRQALEKYTACAMKGLAPSDGCFDEVLTVLETVQKGSSARPRADVLREALLGARQPKVRTPLAIQGGPNLPADVVTQLQQCQRLAEELGTTIDAGRAAKVLELEACRAKAERLDLAHDHDDHGGGAH